MEHMENGKVYRPTGLPLTALEAYLLADDRPDYPMTFTIQLEVAGVIDAPIFETAVARGLERHALLRAKLQGRRGAAHWLPGTHPAPAVDWNVEGVPLDPHGSAHIDLRREAGIRIWVRQGNAQAQLTLQFHHACCDGIGALRFIGDMLAYYGEIREPGAAISCLGPLEPTRLHERGRWWRRDGKATAKAALGWDCIRAMVKNFIWQRPVPLDAPRSPGGAGNPGPAPFPQLVTAALRDADFQRLRRAARQHRVTLNDLLLRDLFLTLCLYNHRAHPCRADRWLRVIMPMDLRGSEDDAMPAANVLSYVFLNRHMRECTAANAARLLAGIREQTRLEQLRRAGAIFLAGTALVHRVGALPLVTHLDTCFATATLTNLGDWSRRCTARLPRVGGFVTVGNLCIKHVVGAPPVRPLTRASFAVSTYGNELCIGLQTDPVLFSRGQAQDLLNLYVGQLAACG